ncbi:MAG: MBL fold metallo-hydrolase [Clostridiales bacterium]|nr:MBL fold metallo-hydrolase [Candidatus Equinaster intestinalis]
MEFKTLVLGSNQTNCYLLWDNNCAVVIDPAEPDSELLQFCENNRDKKYKYILLTHCHFDHIGGLIEAKRALDAPILIGENESEGLQTSDINLSGKWCERVVTARPDRTLADGEEIDLGNEKITVMDTPGHTKGSVCYLLTDRIYSGDTLFNLSVGRYDLPTSSVRALLRSLKKLGALDFNYKIFAGHGEETTLFYEKKYNEFFRRVLDEIK